MFSVPTGREVFAFTQKLQEGWNLQYTASKSHAVRLIGPEVQIFSPTDWTKGLIDKLKVEGGSSLTNYLSFNPQGQGLAGGNHDHTSQVSAHVHTFVQM